VFRTLPTTEAMTELGGYELSRRLSLSMRHREIVIDRTCARCGWECEWGVHVAFFAQRVGLDANQTASLTHDSAEDPCWVDQSDRLLIRAVDTLHDHSEIDDALWRELSGIFSDVNLLDLLLLCGWYHAISSSPEARRFPWKWMLPGSPTTRAVENRRFRGVSGTSQSHISHCCWNRQWSKCPPNPSELHRSKDRHET
jgi:hypothetical protein